MQLALGSGIQTRKYDSLPSPQKKQCLSEIWLEPRRTGNRQLETWEARPGVVEAAPEKARGRQDQGVGRAGACARGPVQSPDPPPRTSASASVYVEKQTVG